MLYELAEEAPPGDPGAFEDAYRSGLAAVVEQVGHDGAVDADVDAETVEAVAAGEPVDLTVTDASRLLALEECRPDAETIRQESLDHLLLGMTNAVLDVETIAANLALDISPTGVQQRIEGRAEMSLVEYAHVHALIEERKP
ncbi:hypothetical protein BRC81_13915 [Halobacteriales archaeon QS_1_68_20]|nr:MAG: hypothetical protein BRC81_13915 [Halobacteriales archaeon QS_1_68_20]